MDVQSQKTGHLDLLEIRVKNWQKLLILLFDVNSKVPLPSSKSVWHLKIAVTLRPK